MQRDDVIAVVEELVQCLVDRAEESNVVAIEASALTVLECDHGEVGPRPGRGA